MKIIGQNDLIQRLFLLLDKGVLSRFIILVGPSGSGKKTLASELSKGLCYYPTLVTDLSKSNIVEIINQSYTTLDTQVYIIADTDEMSLRSKNSLLKVFEEPPNNAYFILTCKNIENVLPTIRSRGAVYYMLPYSRSELSLFLPQELSDKDKDIILDIADTPGDVIRLSKINITEFYNYGLLVADNIAEVSGANVFKIGSKISLKKDSGGYDLELFWRLFRQICFDRINTNIDKYADAILITNKYANELGIRGINLVSLFDAWILDIRSAWMHLE